MDVKTENESLKKRFEGNSDSGLAEGTILFDTEVGSTIGEKFYPAVLRVSELSDIEKLDRKSW
jgi:hypothetical protein